jgi:hypothetical protein
MEMAAVLRVAHRREILSVRRRVSRMESHMESRMESRNVPARQVEVSRQHRESRSGGRRLETT